MPETRPVEVLRVIPEGRAGETDHVVAGDPELVGVRAGMAVPFTTEMVAGSYEMDGAISVQVTDVEADSWFEVRVTLSVPATDAV